MATIVKGKNANKPYTVRYYHEGRQRERSFRTAREARDFKIKFEHDNREQIFVDMRATETFEEAAKRWLKMKVIAPKTYQTYELVLRRYLIPEIGRRRLGAVATQREAAQELLAVTLPVKYKLGASSIRTAYLVLNAIINDNIKSGKLPRSYVRGLKLPAQPQKAEFPFPTRKQIETMAAKMPEPYGLAIYLMRGCGLRIGEALGVRREDFRGGGLRLQRQATPDGDGTGPLKARTSDDFRDIPVPAYVLSRLPEEHGPLFPPVTRRQFGSWFNRARDAAGLPKNFTPHTLRHVFASVALGAGIPITDVSKWLGHRSIQITFGIYGHLVPASWDRARGVLDEEWEA